jgi:hypothetical protein
MTLQCLSPAHRSTLTNDVFELGDGPSAFWHFIQLVTSQQESDSYTEGEKGREMDVDRCNQVFKGKK